MKKLKLQQLKVQSFVTLVDDESKRVKGGYTNGTICVTCPDSCDFCTVYSCGGTCDTCNCPPRTETCDCGTQGTWGCTCM